ncbi:transposase, partial [Methanobrevibacter sp.]|uniref:IS1634 family transposase n=1 Tax=Methanobrevibacter sp. TaxID=66852 RepID=UPI0038702ADB
MSHIYREKREIPIPENGYINKHDGRVFIFIPSDNNAKKRDCKRMNIGKAATEKTMYANENFRFYFPELWEKYYGGSNGKMKYVMHPGMYALTLGVCHKNGLYDLLLDVFGPVDANLMIDYSMYSIMDHSNVSLGYRDRMSSEVMFSHNGASSDTKISEFFSRNITEEKGYDFRSKWLDKCVEKNVTDAWISIDGSNNDCVSNSCILATEGKAKSGKNTPIVSYMYAVCAETGLPLTFDVYHGGSVDSKAFHKVIELLNGHGITVKGIIIDRGFATEEVLEHIRSMNLPFVVMLKSDSYGYMDMVEKHWMKVKVRMNHIVNENGLFGMSERHRIFKKSSPDDFVSIFYDMTNGCARAATLINKVVKAKKEMVAAMADGKKPVPPANLKKYFQITEKSDGTYDVVYDINTWQNDVDRKGFSAIGTSHDFGIEETDRIYNLRNSSEIQYSYIKTQLGSNVTRVHSTDAVLSKFLVCFVSSIIRNEIQRSCKNLGLSTNSTIQEIDRIEILLQQNHNYIAIHNETSRAKLLLASFDILPSDFDIIAAEVTSRFTSSFESLERKKPQHTVTKRKPGRPKKNIKITNSEK